MTASTEHAGGSPTFEEWVAYCFTLGYADFHADPGGPACDALAARERRFLCLPPQQLGAYLARLFRAPAFLAQRYTHDQIADAIWFLFGVGSSYFHDIRYGELPPDLQVEVIASVATLYTDLFDVVCGARDADVDEAGATEGRVDAAVYMIWDMDQIEGTILFPEKAPHLVEPALGVLQTILARCRTNACLTSALHGLGHIRAYHEGQNKALAARALALIDQFLNQRNPSPSVCDYAQAARSGFIL